MEGREKHEGRCEGMETCGNVKRRQSEIANWLEDEIGPFEARDGKRGGKNHENGV